MSSSTSPYLDYAMLALFATFLVSSQVTFLNEFLTNQFNSDIFKLVLENGFFTAISCIGAFYLSVITGCFDSFEWYQLQKQRFEKVMGFYERSSNLLGLFSPQSNTPTKKVETYQLYTTKKAATITYVRGGNDHVVYLPHHSEVLSAMRQYHVRLVTNNGVSDITQQAGLPYQVTASQLGGSALEIFDTITNKVVKTLTKDQVPTIEMFKELSGH